MAKIDDDIIIMVLSLDNFTCTPSPQFQLSWMSGNFEWLVKKKLLKSTTEFFLLAHVNDLKKLP